MMLRFSIRIMLLTLIVCVAIVSAILYGRAHPGAYLLASADFEVCGETLCFMRIMPGITPESRARQLLSLDSGEETGRLFLISDRQMAVGFQARSGGMSDPVVDGISVRALLGTSLFKFGYILERFGTPCRAGFRAEISKDLVVVYPSFSLQISPLGDHISLTSPVTRIDLFPPGNTSCDPLNWSTSIAWPGLTTLAHYQGYEPSIY